MVYLIYPHTGFHQTCGNLTSEIAVLPSYLVETNYQFPKILVGNRQTQRCQICDLVNLFSLGNQPKILLEFVFLEIIFLCPGSLG